MTGIVYDLPDAGYRAEEGITATILKVVDRSSPAHAKAVIDGQIKESDAFDFGKAFHAMLLENRQEFVVHPLTYPSEIKKEIVHKPWSWNANYCKDWAAHQLVDVLSHDESDDLMGMIQSVRSNSELAKLCQGAKNEVSVFAEKNGIKFKSRIDTLPVSGPILDFKSTTDANPQKFVRQAFDKGYFLQAAFYLDVLRLTGDERKEFWFVAIEKEKPYAHSIIKCASDVVSFIALGRIRYQNALRTLLKAKETGKWPSYAPIDAELVASPWMLKELEQSA